MVGIKSCSIRKSNYCTPSSFLVTSHAKIATSICFCWLSEILRIYSRQNISQIAKSIISIIAVYMVNTICGPFSNNVKPSQTVRIIVATINGYFESSDIVFASCNVSSFMQKRIIVIPSFKITAPSKNAGIWIVMKDFAKSFCGKIGLSHDVPFTQIGQRPGRVISIAPASLFYHGAA